MNDQFKQAVIGGIIAGVVKDVPNAILHHYPRLVEITLWDYAGGIALGRLPQGFGEHVYAFFLEILFSIFLGFIFVNLPVRNDYEHYRLQGIFFGAFVWFIIRAAVLAFDIQILLGENLSTSVINLIVSMFYGCVLACSIKYLDEKLP
mgnify:FL=1